jgi:hypothetical protein
MVLWTDIDRNLIECVPTGKDGKFRYKLGRTDGSPGPLRFQIPRGMCTWGLSSYKSMSVELSSPEFVSWWKELEAQLCPVIPFNSNMKGSALRVKVDNATYIFDENSKQVTPEVREGLFRGQELSCLIDVESNYFFNGAWGLTVRASQVKTYGESSSPSDEADEPVTDAGPVLLTGRCAFLPE